MSDKEYKARLLYIDAGDCKEVWEVKHINGGRQYVAAILSTNIRGGRFATLRMDTANAAAESCRASSSYFAMRNGIP